MRRLQILFAALEGAFGIVRARRMSGLREALGCCLEMAMVCGKHFEARAEFAIAIRGLFTLPMLSSTGFLSSL